MFSTLHVQQVSHHAAVVERRTEARPLRMVSLREGPGDVLNGEKGPLFSARRGADRKLGGGQWDFGRLWWRGTAHASLELLHSAEQLGVRVSSGCDASLARCDVFAALAQFGARRLVHGHVVRVAYCVRACGRALQLPRKLLVGLAFPVCLLEVLGQARVALDLELFGRESDPGLIGVRTRQQAFLIVCNLLLLFSSSSCARLASAAKVCGAFTCALFLSFQQLLGVLPLS